MKYTAIIGAMLVVQITLVMISSSPGALLWFNLGLVSGVFVCSVMHTFMVRRVR